MPLLYWQPVTPYHHLFNLRDNEQFIKGAYCRLWRQEAGRRLFRNNTRFHSHLGSPGAVQCRANRTREREPGATVSYHACVSARHRITGCLTTSVLWNRTGNDSRGSSCLRKLGDQSFREQTQNMIDRFPPVARYDHKR
jgi:hypothetical protein